MHSLGLIQNNSLTLANGNSWTITAEDDNSTNIAETLAKTMRFTPGSKRSDQQLLIIKNGRDVGEKPNFLHSAIRIDSHKYLDEPTVCQLPTAKDSNDLALQLMQLSLIFCNQAETQGGLLIHGGLAEKNGVGIILAGPGEAGKSTASRRLPSPWKSLSDDTTLIVRDKQGLYHAHPWPTWSTFMFGGKGGSWDVQHSIPLKAIFLLNQNEKDYIESIGKGQTVCMLNETGEQPWWMLANGFDDQKRQFLNLQRFNNICQLAKTIPGYILHISKNGSFWEEIDQVLFSN